jgi:hypothetical protein
MLSPDTSGIPVKSPFTNRAADEALAPAQMPAFVMVWLDVDGSVETHCHFADEPVPVFVTDAFVETIAVELGSFDCVNSAVSVLLLVPAPVPQPTYAPVEDE